MPRSQRLAARRLKNYAEHATEESDPEPEDSEDESFDEDDEDPDKIEVPGGGKTLEASKHIRKTDPATSVIKTEKVDPKSARQLPGKHIPILKGSIKQEAGIPSASTAAGSRIQQGSVGGGISVPSPLLDTSVFLRLAEPAVSGQGVSSQMSTASPLDNIFAKFFANAQAFANPAFTTLYNNIIATASNTGNSGMQFPMLNTSYDSLLGYMQPQQLYKQKTNLYNPSAWNGAMNSQASVLSNYHNMHPAHSHPQQPVEEEEDAHEDEAMGVAETYADYKPSKLSRGKQHPDPIVETASLASVLPPDIYYQWKLPKEVTNTGKLSALQLEALVYACQQHEHFLQNGERAGFLVGDGAGVGKGRTIAGIIYENHLCSRKKALWVSVSTDLKYDSERDLEDIGAKNIKVYPLNKLKYGRITLPDKSNNGVIFATYSSLIGESSQGGRYNTRLKQILEWCGKDFDGVIVFDECHRAKNLCPVGSTKPTKTGVTVQELQKKLPKARVVYASATGASEPRNMAYMTRLGIWGPGTPFREFNDFINAVEKRGIGAMEIVAMDMKLRGAYIARQLSFHGVTFNIDEVPLDPELVKVYDDSVALWVESMQKFIEACELMKAENTTRKAIWAQFWSSHQRFFKYLCIASKVKHACNVARDAVKCGKCVVIGLQSTGEARTLDQLEKDEGELSDFVSTAKGVLQSLVEKHFPVINKNKVNEVAELIGSGFNRDALKAASQAGPSNSSGSKRKPVRRAAQKAVKRVKLGSDESSDQDNDSDFAGSDISSSGSESYASDAEASDEEFHESSEGESDDSATKAKQKGKRGRKGVQPKVARELPSKEAISRVWEMRKELLDKIEKLGERLPPNTLDQLIDDLGGPEDVAEMTGRKGRVVQNAGGKIGYETRAEQDQSLENINLIEKKRFMNGDKLIAIISEAASSGISLQSDRRVKNTKRRVHITLELPWSADRAIQQFGRTHRSNQLNAPEYVFLISDLAGEHRFASIVAKRLESLGALTHGDRRATETRDLSRFHIDNKYGRNALESVMKFIMGYEKYSAVPPPSDFPLFREDVAAGLVGVGIINNENGNLVLEKDYNNISKFLNRILGMPVKVQNALFKFFTDTLNHIVTKSKKMGRFDLGILDLGDTNSGDLTVSKAVKFKRKHATGLGEIILHTIIVERGMSWKESQEKYTELIGKHEGYYLSNQVRNEKKTAVLVVADSSSSSKGDKSGGKNIATFSIYRPTTGLQLRRESLKDIQSKYTSVKPDEAQPHWEEQYDSSKSTCLHAFWRGNCKNKTMGMDCDVGLRRRTYNVLSGNVLIVWDAVERVINQQVGNAKMQIVRAQSQDGFKVVGLLIPNNCATYMCNVLKEEEKNELEVKQETDTE